MSQLRLEEEAFIRLFFFRFGIALKIALDSQNAFRSGQKAGDVGRRHV
jgi:hypothetical protein